MYVKSQLSTLHAYSELQSTFISTSSPTLINLGHSDRDRDERRDRKSRVLQVCVDKAWFSSPIDEVSSENRYALE